MIAWRRAADARGELSDEIARSAEPDARPDPQQHRDVVIIRIRHGIEEEQGFGVDCPAVAEAMSPMLELEGFDVRIASCEQEALEQVGERAPDLLISDYHLRGGETGLGVVTALRRALDADIPAVFVTGDTARTALDAAELGHIRVLTKPLRAEELLETINTELAIARAPRPAAASS